MYTSVASVAIAAIVATWDSIRASVGIGVAVLVGSGSGVLVGTAASTLGTGTACSRGCAAADGHFKAGQLPAQIDVQGNRSG